MSGEKHIGFYYEFFSFKKSKIGHGITTWNTIPSIHSNTVTEFSKTFPVFYKWPDLTDVQVVLTTAGTGTVPFYQQRASSRASCCWL
jgi:hypothetical protein